MSISYDSKSFIINGKREWLLQAEIHYFRFPAAEWKTVIRMAKAAGANVISTYLAWNYHEKEEGKFDFTGDRNFAEFIDIAKEEGLFVFLRPGPYICAEWTGGGLPPYLLNYEDLQIRVNEENFMRCTERWFKNALEFVVPRLVTNGGNIIAVQNDNEYPGGWDEISSSYIINIYNLLRKYGVDVPITACNAHCVNGKLSVNYGAGGDWKDLYKDIITTYNTAGETQIIPELKDFQPDKPTILTELWTGPQIYWKYPPAPLNSLSGQHSNLCRFTGLQSMVTLYMFAGGNNYEFYPGGNLATSYASTYPIGEANRPIPEYYNIKVMGSFIKTFGDFISKSDYKQLVYAESYSQTAEEGTIAYVVTDKSVCTYTLDGKDYTVNIGEIGFGMFPHDFKFCGSIVNADASLVARYENMLFFMACAGEERTINVDGKDYTLTAKYHDINVADAGSVKIVLCDEYTAKRIWFTNNGLVIGPEMAYETENGLYIEQPKAGNVITINNGEIKREFRPADAPVPPMPVIKDWEINEAFDSLEFTKIQGPMAHNKLNVPHGYVWYKAKTKKDKAGYSMLMVSSFHNRILVYVNGKFAGMFGDNRFTLVRWNYENPTGAMTEMVPVYLEEGENEILFLSEDTGYTLDDPKPMGILSDVYADSRLVEIKNTRFIGRTPILPDAMDFMYSKTVKDMDSLNTLEFDLNLADDEDVFFICHAKPCYIYINGESANVVKLLKKPWQSFPHSVMWITYLSNDTIKRNNTVRIQYYCTTEQILSELQMYVVKKDSKLYDWEFCPFKTDIKTEGRTDFEASTAAASTLLVPTGEAASVTNGFTPKYFTTHFKMPESKAVLLSIGKLNKGQILLNGKNIGKFFGTHTQSLYYLPKAYMKEDNELTLFEEYGTLPEGVRLIGK